MNLVDRIIAGFGPEDHEQYVFVQWCETLGYKVYHVPNSTWTKSIMVRTRNTLLGVRRGVPDLGVLIPGVGLLIIEMKRPKVKGSSNNYPTPAQREWIEAFNTIPGVQAMVCYGADEAIAFVKKFTPVQQTLDTKLF